MQEYSRLPPQSIGPSRQTTACYTSNSESDTFLGLKIHRHARALLQTLGVLEHKWKDSLGHTYVRIGSRATRSVVAEQKRGATVIAAEVHRCLDPVFGAIA